MAVYKLNHPDGSSTTVSASSESEAKKKVDKPVSSIKTIKK